MNFKVLDVVTLTHDIPSLNLKKGRKGTVVHIFTAPHPAFEVEFVDENGATTAQLTLKSEDIE